MINKVKKIIDDDTQLITKNFISFLKGKLRNENSLGFVVPKNELVDNIFIPEHYLPEIKIKLNALNKKGDYEFITFGKLNE